MTESEIRDAVREAAKLAKASNPLTPSITNTVTINFVAMPNWLSAVQQRWFIYPMKASAWPKPARLCIST